MEGEILNIIKVWMEGEINNFIKVWLSVFISLSYCYVAAKIVPKGTPRLFTLLPVVCLFLNLPLHLHTMHLGGLTAFFIAWLANFKILMLAFGIGPLSDPSISLPRFLAIACLPIKIQQNPPPNQQNPSQNFQDKPNPSQEIQNEQNPSLNGHIKQNPSPKIQDKQNPSPNSHIKQNSYLKNSIKGHKSPWNYAVKALFVASFIRVYDYSEQIHPTVMMFIYIFHIYFILEVILAMVAALARALLGLELEPQFNEPYLSTSLQDFWGRRWNIMVSRILRPSVYDPVLKISTQIMGRKWAPLPAVFTTFVVSALMHELVFYYLGRLRSTGEITWFFLLHGLCLLAEIAIKKAFKGSWRLPQVISGPLTVGFVIITGFWLFLPELLRLKGDVRAFEEYAKVGAFVKDVSRALISK